MGSLYIPYLSGIRIRRKTPDEPQMRQSHEVHVLLNSPLGRGGMRSMTGWFFRPVTRMRVMCMLCAILNQNYTLKIPLLGGVDFLPAQGKKDGVV
jgi:hypothetical protein